MRGMFKILENIGCGGCKRIKYHVNTFSTPIQHLSSLPPPQQKTNKQKQKNRECPLNTLYMVVDRSNF